MPDENTTRLKRKRSVARASVTKYIAKLETELAKVDSDPDIIEELLEHLAEKSQDLKLIDSEIELVLDPKVLEAELESADEYRENITSWKFKATKRLRTLKNITREALPPSQRVGTGLQQTAVANVKLPKFSIDRFCGDVSEWLTFWNSFESAIHLNESLDKVSKFTYLRAHLGSIALGTIGGFAITPENYDTAVKMLKERFGHKELLINTHMGNLLNIPNLKSSNDLKTFREIVDNIQTQVRSLDSLGVDASTYGNLLCPLLLKVLPPDLVLDFHKETEKCSYEVTQLIEFLSQQLIIRERANMISQIENSHFRSPPVALSPRHEAWLRPRHEPTRRKPTDGWQSRHILERKPRPITGAELISVDVNKHKSCAFCNKSHQTSECENYQSFSLEERKTLLTKAGACYRCLKAGHISRLCKVKVICSLCGNRHLSIMCFSKNNVTENKSENKNKNEIIENSVLTNNSRKEEIYLQTLIVCISENNLQHFVRIVIDTGSQRSYVSKFVAKVMKLKCVGEETVIHGLFGGIEKSERHKRYCIKLSNIDRSIDCDIEVMDQEKICASLPKLMDSKCIYELNNCGIFASDIVMNENSCLYEKNPNEIHVLLGADFAGKLFTGEIKHLSNGLLAMNTQMGWTIMGRAGEMETNNSNVLISLHVNDSKISDLWKLDTLGILDPGEKINRKDLEDAAKDHFLRNITRDEEGRYVVHLPWIKDHPPLSSCRGLAERRLGSCVKSLQQTGNLDVYENVLKNWSDEGIIEEVDPSNKSNEREHFLPHHPVYKENSTTAVRPVFDGSARDKNTPSINDCLEKGPNVIELLPTIMNRFRLGKFGVISDIKKAFLQIGLQKSDRPFLRFLWKGKNKDGKLQIFQHNRVVFGISSSSFLLGATLEFHLRNAPKHLQETAQKLEKSFYVDNCVTSVNSAVELVKFISESQVILNAGKFDLRGWEHTATRLVTEDETESKKKVLVLGLNWNPTSDTLSVDLKEFSKFDKVTVTKRAILSVVHRIFDPIGFTCPVTLRPKLLLQECWKNGFSWDTELPRSINNQFERWKSQIESLEDLKIPRCLLTDSLDEADLSIHVFCDASKIAYATCIFLRCQTVRTTTCQLIQARSRIAPVKCISIPRMELLACLIGARLTKNTISDLDLEDVPIFYWSDSVNALYWITRNENWATFVFNRVQEIRRLTDSKSWKHVAGVLNPADLPSRGCTVEELKKSRWWEGPSWLRQPRDKWPISNSFPDLEIVNSEKRKSVVSASNTEQRNFEHFSRISSYNKIKRIMAWILRFCKNARSNKNERNYGELNVEEVDQAEKTILKEVQRQCFGESRKTALQTFLDSDGLLRVKTRITLRKDLEAFRHPIVLPSKHHIVTKLILDKHTELFHAGLQVLMSTLRENYWIIKSRKTIRQVLRSCTKCKRFTARPLEALSAPLPEDRVREALVFEVIGVDLCGPLYLKNNTKAWVVLFTCAVFRALHIELVTSLSTDSFILALRRFISRRGRPTTIYSDNGTNLVGTSNELKSINWERLQKYATIKKIQWKFNPPSAPWWGGFWERLIGMLKAILRKILGRACLQYEELYTVLCDAESTINSRPLTYLSEDINDLAALTPAMFLQEIKEAGVPDMDLIDSNRMNKRFAYRQKIRQDLRKRFRIEYLGQLREFYKVRKESNISEGDVVLVGDDNSKRLNWPLAKVIKLCPGRDGRVRVVQVQTSSGSFLRPVQRLYPLEIRDGEPISTDTSSVLVTDKQEGRDAENLRTYVGELLKPTKRMNL